MEINFLAVIAASFTTLLVGFVYYHPKVFGTIWMKETGLTEEELKKGNMLKIFGLTLIFSFLIAFMMQMFTIHQYGAFGMIGGDEKLATASYTAFMAEYENAYRTFKHGALHGCMTALLFVFPILGINGLFEHKSWRYILVHAGYWVVSLTIIGGIICGWK
jgi:hypothetical protein